MFVLMFCLKETAQNLNGNNKISYDENCEKCVLKCCLELSKHKMQDGWSAKVYTCQAVSMEGNRVKTNSDFITSFDG